MTTAKQNSTFLDDIDSDSVSITSTVASEPQEEYEVETILAEEEGDDGINYLIKWEGYPLHRWLCRAFALRLDALDAENYANWC